MKRWQVILKKVMIVLSSITGLVLFVVLLTSAMQKQKELVCAGLKINVDYDSGLSFVSKADVAERVMLVTGDSVQHKKLASLNLQAIERALEKQPYIDSAEVYFNQQLNLMVKVLQKRPILRIINNDGVGYYLSDKAETIPLSGSFTPRVLVALGYVQQYTDAKRDSVVRLGLWKLTTAIEKDTFLYALTDHINVLENGEVELVPTIGDLTIVFGNPQVKTAEKLNRIKTFYREALPRVGWDKYKSMNVKFDNQVVCVKKEPATDTLQQITVAN